MVEHSEADAADVAGVEVPHHFLRRLTRPWHDGVEQAFERFDLQTVDGLRAFLTRQAAALMPLERALEAARVEHLLPDWPLRRRAPLIMADLALLGSTEFTMAAPPLLEDTPVMLGTLYVLEGSKLGGRVLHRRVLASLDPRVRGADRFLGHRHDRGWPTFLAVLDRAGFCSAERNKLLAGARIAFAAFRGAAESHDSLAFADASTRFGRYHPAHV